jgi:hypothetical protein
MFVGFDVLGVMNRKIQYDSLGCDTFHFGRHSRHLPTPFSESVKDFSAFLINFT